MCTYPIVHDKLSLLQNALKRLAELIPRLHEASEQCARANEPLVHVSEMNWVQMPQLAEQIRAANQERERVTGQIREVFDLIDEWTQRTSGK